MQIKPKKYIYATAVAAVLSVGATAANAEATLYGHLHVSIDRFDSDAAADTVDNQSDGFNIASNTSRVGVKGSEDLGAGLKGLYQAEFGFNADEDNDGLSSQRNTFVGLSGGFGAVRVGRHDTPYKSSTGRLDPFSETVGDANGIISSANGAPAVFDSRISNQILYSSPKFGPFSFAAQYAVDRGGTGQPNGADKQAATSISVSGTYSQGPLFVTLAVESRDDDTAPAANSDGTKFGVGYDFGFIKAGVVAEQLESDTSTSALNRDALFVNVNGMLGGQNKWAVSFGQAKDSDAPGAEDGADLIAVGLFHNFSKTVRGYVAYAQMDNDAGGTYRLGDGGHGDVVGVAAGDDPTSFSVGMVVDF